MQVATFFFSNAGPALPSGMQMDNDAARSRASSANAQKNGGELPRPDDESSRSGTESSSSIAGEETAELLANCLSSADPSDVSEGLKALEALVSRHRACSLVLSFSLPHLICMYLLSAESASHLEDLGVVETTLRLARLLPSSVQTLSLDPVQNYALLLLCTMACNSGACCHLPWLAA